MKKAVSLILALTLCVALAVPAFAADYQLQGQDFYTLKADREPISAVEPENESGSPVYTMDVNTTFTLTRLSTGEIEDSYTLYIIFEWMYSAGYGSYIFNPKTGSTELIGKGTSYEDAGLANSIPVGESVSFKLPADLMDKDKVTLRISYDLFGTGWSSAAWYYIIPTGTLDDTSAAPAQTTTEPTTATEPTTTATAPAQTTTPAGSGSYTAQKYDTYGKLAVNYYGSYAYTKALQKANGYKALKAGAAVTLPDKLGNAARLAPAVAGAGEKLYTVVAGDTLGTIAKAYYGNSAQYKAIFERNADRLANANTIYEGQIIVLPAK